MGYPKNNCSITAPIQSSSDETYEDYLWHKSYSLREKLQAGDIEEGTKLWAFDVRISRIKNKPSRTLKPTQVIVKGTGLLIPNKPTSKLIHHNIHLFETKDQCLVYYQHFLSNLKTRFDNYLESETTHLHKLLEKLHR